MSRFVRHLLMAGVPVEAGSIEYWDAGTYNFTVPRNFNTLRIRMVGGGGGGYYSSFGSSGPGTAGGDSKIDALGLKATGGGGAQGKLVTPQYPGVGSGGDINNTGTLGTQDEPGTPVPGLGGGGVGGKWGASTPSQYGHGSGYVEKLYTIGDLAVLPNSTFQIIIGAAGRSKVYNGNAVYYGTPGACVIEWQ